MYFIALIISRGDQGLALYILFQVYASYLWVSA